MSCSEHAMHRRKGGKEGREKEGRREGGGRGGGEVEDGRSQWEREANSPGWVSLRIFIRWLTVNSPTHTTGHPMAHIAAWCLC